MRKENLWGLYQKARAARARAEIAVIEKRAACESAEDDFDDATRKEQAAGDAWLAATREKEAVVKPGAES